MRVAALTALVLVACARGPGFEVAPKPAPPPPPGCRTLPAGADVQAALDQAADDDALCLAPGHYAGPLHITHRVRLWGPRTAVVRADQPGNVIVIGAAGATLSGLTIDGQGGSFDREDAAVRVAADDVIVEGIAVIHPVYGVIVERARRVHVRGNQIHGNAHTALGMRGDTIRLWEVTDSEVTDNLVEDGRDVVIFYSSRNRITGNTARRGRYGTHLMYSHDNLIADNRYTGVVVGVFIMYSRGVTLQRNLIADAGGAAGMAIGLKDSGAITVDSNLLIRNSTGLYVDDSPNQVGDAVTVRGNVIRQCELAVAFHTTPRGVTLTGNDLADNRRTVELAGGLDPAAAQWRGNYFDEYEGYDLDDDGTGDVPHSARSTAEALIGAHPALAFFRGSPALGALDAAARLVPLWPEPPLLVDPAPRMAARDLEEVLRAR